MTENGTSFLPVLVTGGVDFRPRPNRTLDRGKWIGARKHSAEELLFSRLRSLCAGTPVDVFTEETKARMLAEFDWTPLALMTHKQARNARIEFVRANAALTMDAMQLAHALKSAKLYSEDTSLSQIRRFLPSLLKAAHIPG
jgi:hypothetical protein